MKRQSRVVWSKGLFLTPQLFDAQQRFFEGEFQFRSTLSGFQRWGINEIELDETAISQGKIRLLKCSGVFDNGLTFSMPEADALPGQVSFVQSFPPDQTSLDVFLTIQERRFGERNAVYDAAPSARFLIAEETVYDDVDAEEEIIQVGRPNFRILFGGQSLEGTDAIQITRIKRSGDGAFYGVDPEYIPPCLNVACSKPLWTVLLPKLLGRLQFVSEQLAKQRSFRSELLSYFDDSDIRRFWVLDLVNEALPELLHVHGIGYCHPDELYRILLRMRGRLCTFFKEEEYRPASGFQKYDHRQLGLCLPPLVRNVDRMLQDLAYRKRRCQVFPLTPDGDRQFKTQVNKELLEKGTLYLGLIKDPNLPSGLDFQANLKVVGPATRTHAATLAGLQLKQQQQSPSDCPRKEGYTYFQILRPTLESVLHGESPSGAAYSRTSSPEMARSVTARRAEVWQDVAGSGGVYVVTLNDLLIRQPEVLLTLPELEGYMPLPEMPPD